MSDDLVNIEVNGVPLKARKGQMIMQVTDPAHIYIPRFCYHEKLTVAANCRMCLVEIAPPPGQRPMQLDILAWDAEKNDYVVTRKPKLQPACQVAAGENMEVKSESSSEVSGSSAATSSSSGEAIRSGAGFRAPESWPGGGCSAPRASACRETRPESPSPRRVTPASTRARARWRRCAGARSGPGFRWWGWGADP